MRKEVFAWGMYDLANTIFSALFVTFFFPFYIKEFLGGNEFQIGLAFGLSMLAVACVVPFIGAASDRMNRRMPFIIVFTILCCIFTVVVIQVPLLLALIAGGIANFCFHAALTTYNALLPVIASKRDLGRVSGFGIGMGYVGTIISLVVAALLLSRLGWETEAGVRSMFYATAVMFFLFSLFTFFGIKERKGKPIGVARIMRDASNAVKKTVFQFKKHKNFLYFLLSMFCYINAINAVILFLFLFARDRIGLTVPMFLQCMRFNHWVQFLEVS